MWGAAARGVARRAFAGAVEGCGGGAVAWSGRCVRAAQSRSICRSAIGAMPKMGAAGATFQSGAGAGWGKIARRCLSDWRARGDLQPAPRKLSEVVKLPLLKREDSGTVKKIWLDHHLGNKEEDAASTSHPVVACTMDAGEYNLLRARAATCPFFIFPVRRDTGHFVMLVQWQDSVCLFTFLEEYKKNPHGAEPWAAMTMYNELVGTHGVALSRFDYNPLHMTKLEATRLMDLVRIFFVEGNQYEQVEAFNHRPDDFDYERHIRECQ